MMASRGIGDDGTYLINDNGHINQRSQSYISLAKQPIQPVDRENVGPGQYESVSAFKKGGARDIVGPVFGQKSNEGLKQLSPSVSRNQDQIRISAPSIPSRYYAPFIDEKDSQDPSKIVLQHEFCTISKVVDDPAKVGPGSYEISGDLKNNPKNVISWRSPGM